MPALSFTARLTFCAVLRKACRPMNNAPHPGPLVLSPIEIECLFLAIDNQLRQVSTQLPNYSYRSPPHDALTEIAHHLSSARNLILAARERRAFPALA
jgi:hypothetical protein